ncbi:MAG TPA: sigma-70 family RNA polymerase sigma factor [Stellaceae bacterium]|jgi:RNA polymerase sigma-70 factor (ECF subfamily)|nr:sigma-70 family RNA polymerase sigma factor [Stellaceae bacterium]
MTGQVVDRAIEQGDAVLMRQVAEGSEAAFRLVAQRHLPRMLRLASKTLGGSSSAGDAEDVVQEALVRLWQHAGNWQPQRGALSTWLYTVVYRLCVDRLRLKPTVALDEAIEVADSQPHALDTMMRAGEFKALDTAIAALQPRQRAALTLFYYEEMSGPEAASVLGLGLRAFWSLLHRARQAVHEEMKSVLRQQAISQSKGSMS